MQKTITIDQAILLQRVRLTLAYNADRNPSVSDRYTDVAMTTSDQDLAEKYWDDALTWVATALKRFGGEALPDATGIGLLMISPNSVAAKTSIITNVVTLAVEYKIVSDWLTVVNDMPSRDKYRERAQAYIEEATDLCLRRVRPARLSR